MTVPITIRKYGMSTKLALRNIYLRLISKGGPFLCLMLAAVLHGHGGRLYAEEADKTARSQGGAERSRAIQLQEPVDVLGH